MNESEVVKLPLTSLLPGMKALRRMAGYEMEEGIQVRMHHLGERKEFLSEEEHRELGALVEFTEHRMIERLEAELALRQLEEVLPGIPKAS